MPTALIVEDEPVANKLLSSLLQLKGYRTNSALTGAEALSSVDHDPPDVVFLDLMLPDVNGYSVCSTLKSTGKTSAIPVVIVTARVAQENRTRCFNLGADDFVAKPYIAEDIYQALDDAAAWSEGLDDLVKGGLIEYRSEDDGESLRRIAQLLNALLARTPLERPAVEEVGSALRRAWSKADEWGRANDVQRVATLEHETFDDRVEFRISDVSGWLQSGEAHGLGEAGRAPEGPTKGPSNVRTWVKRFAGEP